MEIGSSFSDAASEPFSTAGTTSMISVVGALAWMTAAAPGACSVASVTSGWKMISVVASLVETRTVGCKRSTSARS